MNRHKNRESAAASVYQILLVGRDVEDAIADNLSEEERLEDEYMVRVIRTAAAHSEEYKTRINELLDDWTFDRLGAVEQAILLIGCAETEIGEVAQAVIIDEAVELAKKYGDDSYRLINGVLDKL